MGPKERGLGEAVCKRVVIVWDTEYRLGKEECMAMMDVRHGKSGRVKALEMCEVRE